MSAPLKFSVAFAACLYFSASVGDASADQSVCDTLILNRPGCEVGDFGGTGVPESPYAHATAESLFLSAEYYVKNQKFEVGIKLLNKALDWSPDDKDTRDALYGAHLKYGDDLKSKNDVEGATREYKAAMSICKGDKEAKRRLKELSKKHPLRP